VFGRAGFKGGTQGLAVAFGLVRPHLKGAAGAPDGLQLVKK